MLAISLTIACSRYVYYGVILHAHPVRGESHNQLNTTREVATIETGPRVVRSNSCKGPSPSWKRAKRKFWGQEVLFGTNFLKFGNKRANLATHASMVRRPEPSKKSVERTTLGITVTEIQLDQFHSAIAVTTTTLYVAQPLRHIRCWRIVQRETRQPGVRIFSILMLMRMNPLGHELNLD